MTANILKYHPEYTIEYPQAIKFCEQQEDIFWMAKEIELEKDLTDLKTNLTEAELHGVTTVLRLFTEYELRVGGDYWLDVMMKEFHRPELHRMFASFGAIELNVHAPFYAKINELLGLNTKEFYTGYKQDPVLMDRMRSIGEALQIDADVDTDLPTSIACFSLIEGAILYSNFAFLKHFQAEGKNKLMNLVAGINFSVRDENLHSLASAWLYQTLMKEGGYYDSIVVPDVYKFAAEIYEHECRIIDMIFEKGTIPGITDIQLKHFVESRINLCLEQLGLERMFEVTYNPIGKWFYKNIQQSQLHDFFAKQGNNYTRDWKEQAFTWQVQN